VVVWGALLAAMLRYATPLIFAAMGGMFSERSGVTNIGLEGMMLIGAFFGILGSDKLGQWYYGLIVAIIAGGLMALLHAVPSINLRADQIVGGTAINFLALGLTGYLFIDIYGQEGTPTDISSIPQVNLGFLDDVPFVGTVFGHLNLMIWVALILIPLAWVILFKTPLGLGSGRSASTRRPPTRSDLGLRRALRRCRLLGHARAPAVARISRSGSSTRSTRT
jgi:simple sugar transport system permease protein